MKELTEYNKAYIDLAYAFAKKYYTDEEWFTTNPEIIGSNPAQSPWPVMINDDYWRIDEIYEALYWDFDYERMMERKEREVENEWIMPVNFYNYCWFKCFDLDGMKD